MDITTMASYAGVDLNTMYRLIRSKRFPAPTLGNAKYKKLYSKQQLKEMATDEYLTTVYPNLKSLENHA